MKAGKGAGRAAPAILPLVLLVVPKCPLCLLPLFAAAGSVLPPAPLLDGLVVATALAWLTLLAGVARSATARAVGLCGVLLLLGGRWLGVPAACWAGALVMVAVVARKRARDRDRTAPCAPMIHCAG